MTVVQPLKTFNIQLVNSEKATASSWAANVRKLPVRLSAREGAVWVSEPMEKTTVIGAPAPLPVFPTPAPLYLNGPGAAATVARPSQPPAPLVVIGPLQVPVMAFTHLDPQESTMVEIMTVMVTVTAVSSTVELPAEVAAAVLALATPAATVLATV